MNNPEHSHSYESEYRGCVLIVDDHARVRQMLALALRTAGFDVVAACTQQQAQRRLEHSRPDALVLNLQRSEADGLDMLRGMRARPDLADLPIVFLAGCDSDDFRWQAIRAGADWFGLRPLGMSELKKRIRQLIHHGRPPRELIPQGAGPRGAHRLKPTG